MQYCVDFALANRRLMMERIQEVFSAVAAPVTFSSFINIAHNYAALETHFRRNVIVHRKGATSAPGGGTGDHSRLPGHAQLYCPGPGQPGELHLLLARRREKDGAQGGPAPA